jgi:enterochelin esterase-like enzyme
MTKSIVLSILFVAGSTCYAQDYTLFTKTVRSLYASPAEAEKQWRLLVDKEQVPFAIGDSVAFLYHGEAKSVAWMGDFNGWGYDKKFNNKGSRIPGTTLWLLKTSFPADARLDYKIVVNETNLLLDPVNPHQQWSGVGGGSPNSELRMPLWKPEAITQFNETIPHGKTTRDILIHSTVLDYQLTYTIYTPPSYNATANIPYPVLYVTDGYEYLHEQMGNMPVVLDNLIHAKKIKPVIVVFIDHREPVNRSNNRRMQELAMNEQYRAFVTTELIPDVEKQYPVSRNPKERAILGTSMGGLTAAYFAFSKPDFFGLAGIQSPAFWFKPEIYTLCDHAANPAVKVFLTTGTINDTQEGVEKMKTILNRNTCQYGFKQVNQGHSWGNWRDLTDDILIYFFPSFSQSTD